MDQLIRTIEALNKIALDNVRNWAGSYDKVYVEYSTSNQGYGYTTKVAEVDPLKFCINDLVKLGLKSNNCFSSYVHDFHGFETVVKEDSVQKISLVNKLYERLGDLPKDTALIVYALPLKGEYAYYEYSAKIEYDVAQWALKIDDNILDELNTYDWELHVVEASNPLSIECEDYYYDDPGCGIYRFYIKE